MGWILNLLSAVGLALISWFFKTPRIKQWVAAIAIFLLVCGTILSWRETQRAEGKAREAQQAQQDANDKIDSLRGELRETHQELQKANTTITQLHQELQDAKATIAQLNLNIIGLSERLGKAKDEESQKVITEVINSRTNDIAQWAKDFVPNLPSKRTEFFNLKADVENRQREKETKERQIQTENSAQLKTVFSLAAQMLQAYAHEYAVSVGNTNIQINPFKLPDNLYEKETNSEIRFSSNAVWSLNSTTGGFDMELYQFGGYNLDFQIGQPFFKIVFQNGTDQKSDKLYLRLSEKRDKIRFTYTGKVPENITGEYDISDYYALIIHKLQSVVEAQIEQQKN